MYDALYIVDCKVKTKSAGSAFHHHHIFLWRGLSLPTAELLSSSESVILDLKIVSTLPV